LLSVTASPFFCQIFRPIFCQKCFLPGFHFRRVSDGKKVSLASESRSYATIRSLMCPFNCNLIHLWKCQSIKNEQKKRVQPLANKSHWAERKKNRSFCSKKMWKKERETLFLLLRLFCLTHFENKKRSIWARSQDNYRRSTTPEVFF
jgi:hypothetical protein